MDPAQVASALAGSGHGGGQQAGSTLRDPVATPVAPSAPPLIPSAPGRSSGRRRDNNTWAIVAVVTLVGAGIAAAAVWGRPSDNDDSGSGKTIPLPPPPTTVQADPTPTAPDSPSSDSPPPGGSDSPPPTAPTATGDDPPPGQKAASDGWIPPEATEATRVASLHADPAKDPLCQKPPSPVDIGKEITIAFEKELREATKVTDAEESKIGARLESAIARDPSFAGKWDLPGDVARYGQYLTDLVNHLAKGKSRKGIDYRVHLVHKPEFNAAALPGGVLMVNTGALEGDDAVEDEAELVAVLGHEISHVEKRHTIASYQYAKAVFGEAGDAQIAIKVLSTPISSEYELEADDNGLRLAVEAQYDPQAAVELWRRHAKTERPAPGGLLGGVLDSLTRSHPRAAVRACQAMKMVNWTHDNARWTRVYDGKTNLQTRVMGPRKAY